jgi:hypothetical protein
VKDGEPLTDEEQKLFCEAREILEKEMGRKLTVEELLRLVLCMDRATEWSTENGTLEPKARNRSDEKSLSRN